MSMANQTKDQDELVTVAEAARLVSLSPITIRRYSNAGRLPTLRTPSNHRRFRKGDVLDLITTDESQKPGAGTPGQNIEN